VIRARLDGDTSAAPFRYFDKGGMAMFGRRMRVGALGQDELRRFPCVRRVGVHRCAVSDRLGKSVGHLVHLGRALWFTHDRAHRIITLDQACDEMRHERPAGSAVRSVEPRVISADD